MQTCEVGLSISPKPIGKQNDWKKDDQLKTVNDMNVINDESEQIIGEKVH